MSGGQIAMNIKHSVHIHACIYTVCMYTYCASLRAIKYKSLHNCEAVVLVIAHFAFLCWAWTHGLKENWWMDLMKLQISWGFTSPRVSYHNMCGSSMALRTHAWYPVATASSWQPICQACSASWKMHWIDSLCPKHTRSFLHQMHKRALFFETLLFWRVSLREPGALVPKLVAEEQSFLTLPSGELANYSLPSSCSLALSTILSAGINHDSYCSISVVVVRCWIFHECWWFGHSWYN